MAFRDWRSPGERWVRTDFGWRRLAEIRKTLNTQLRRQFSHSSSSSKTSSAGSSKKQSRAGSPFEPRDLKETNNETVALSFSEVSRPSWPCSFKQNEKIEKQVTHLHLMLAQRCISARSSSRESCHYSTIADAMIKLNFEQALQDSGCFAFICEVVALVFEIHQRALSGSLQNSLLRIIDRAKDIAVQSKQHSGLVLTVIGSAVSSLEKIRHEQFTGFGVRNIDSKLKSLLKMKRQLQSYQYEEEQLQSRPTSMELVDLPSDCLRHIVSFLTHPRDVVNLGATNTTFQSVTEESQVWRNLTVFHYGPVTPEVVQAGWKDTFVKQFRIHRGQLKSALPTAVCFCKKCYFVYWKRYGHPCLTTTPHNESNKEQLHQYLSTVQFLQLFVF